MEIEMNEEKGLKYDALVVCSGGLDSTTMLYWLIDEGKSCAILTFDHPTRTMREKECVEWHAESLGLPIMTWTADKLYSQILKPGTGELRQKPCRNLIFASIAANIACHYEIPKIAMGIQSVDVDYLDCTPWNVRDMQAIIHMLTNWTVELIVPFLGLGKTEIVDTGLQLGVPYERTYSCYEPGPKHCGECHSCKERIEAFEMNDIKRDDPRVLP